MNCEHEDSTVLDTRKHSDGIWRRRKCLKCECVFWTVEKPAERRKGFYYDPNTKVRQTGRYKW